MNIEMMIPGVPEPKGSKHLQKRGGKVWMLSGGNAKAHERLKDWEHRVRHYATATTHANGIPEPSDEPLACDVTFCLPRPKSAAKRTHCAVKPDLDKLCRGVLDGLIGIVTTEDSRIVSLTARKVYADADNPPGAWVRIWSV